MEAQNGAPWKLAFRSFTSRYVPAVALLTSTTPAALRARPVSAFHVSTTALPRPMAVTFVPSLVRFVIPPKAPLLLYWTWVLLPPGAPPAGTAQVASSLKNFVVPATDPGEGTSPAAPAPPLSP